MASLSTNWYLRDTAAGRLQLPDYEIDDEGDIYLYYGEVFCRVPECSKANHNYKYTNNLRTHIETHDDVSLSAGNVGGRASQKIIDEAIKFYKRLYGGVEPGTTTTPAPPASSPPSSAISPAATAVYDPVSPSTTGASILPVLPVKKDGTVHVTNMRAAVAKMGHKIPCESCSTRTACCKDINLCDFFIFFDCGDMHPRAAIVEPEEEGETA
ncbi:hypothetical protein BO71DRAFT_415769 [Aspergillus ellipticus CBS 707.79]|uniref:Uncharacterized protein n=1 Tax=Aspergillus ellipticus CBS 707.79 TaxID=1448320 RepID=A0A319E623_9EURO|nr:hypothetical protein BO71DRAFT_415769 [Aspergillus ellipticus CBS 707.79]